MVRILFEQDLCTNVKEREREEEKGNDKDNKDDTGINTHG